MGNAPGETAARSLALAAIRLLNLVRAHLWALTTAAALVGVALATRLPHLGDVPRLTDETAEALLALSIAQGRALPLTNVDPYIGPHLAYVVAALYRVFGPDPLLPRLLVMICGVLSFE